VAEKSAMVGDFIDGGGLASVMAQIGETMVNKRADQVLRDGPKSRADERLLKSRGYEEFQPGEYRQAGGRGKSIFGLLRGGSLE
jgi:hypothetical protein